MADRSIYKDIAERTGGDIYVGVVGPVGNSVLVPYYNMKGKRNMKELYEALAKLGIKGTNIIVHWITTDRIAVYIDGEYFGIWDTRRKTFID